MHHSEGFFAFRINQIKYVPGHSDSRPLSAFFQNFLAASDIFNFQDISKIGLAISQCPIAIRMVFHLFAGKCRARTHADFK